MSHPPKAKTQAKAATATRAASCSACAASRRASRATLGRLSECTPQTPKKEDNMTTCIDMTPVRIAWLLAGAHGHHWASYPATPAALAAGRARRVYASAMRDTYTPWTSSGSLREAAEAAEAAWRAELDAERRALSDERDLSLPALTQGEREGWDIAPTTPEEAEAMGWLPSGPCGGIAFGWAHITSSGRLRWRVDPDRPHVLIEVWRPQGLAIAADVTWRGGRVSVAVDATPIARARHVETMDSALGVIGLPSCPEEILREP